jgi:hypothetical protein
VKNTRELISTFWQLITGKRKDSEKYPRSGQNILAINHGEEKGKM